MFGFDTPFVRICTVEVGVWVIVAFGFALIVLSHAKALSRKGEAFSNLQINTFINYNIASFVTSVCCLTQRR